MRLRLMLAAMAAVLLSGCWWVGPPFYTGNPADAAPITPGRYRIDIVNVVDPRVRPDSVKGRFVWRSDGSVQWIPASPRKSKDTPPFVMIRFALPARDLWITQTPAHSDDGRVTYGLIERRGAKFWALPVIDCDTTADIVRAAGGEVSGGTVAVSGVDAEPADYPPRRKPKAVPPPAAAPDATPQKPTNQWCTFKDRPSFETALRAYLATNPRFPVRLRFTRLGW